MAGEASMEALLDEIFCRPPGRSDFDSEATGTETSTLSDGGSNEPIWVRRTAAQLAQLGERLGEAIGHRSL